MLMKPPIIGREVYSSVNDAEATTSLAPPAWVTHTTLTLPATASAGKYWFWASAEWTMDDENNPNYGRVILDGATVINEWIAAFKKKYDPIGIFYYYPLMGMHDPQLTAGVHTFALQFAAGGGKVARIRHAHLFAWRVGD